MLVNLPVRHYTYGVRVTACIRNGTQSEVPQPVVEQARLGTSLLEGMFSRRYVHSRLP